MFEPTNEQGVVVLFAQHAEQAGFEIIEIGIQYPDAVIRKDGQDYKVEFEYQSSNFLYHKHDPSKCDFIVCYIHDWVDCPLPVIELKSDNWRQTNLHKDIGKLADWWRTKALSLETSLTAANKRIASLENKVNWQKNIEEANRSREEIVTKRREKLAGILEDRPDLTNVDLSNLLEVSVSTIKGDKRAMRTNGHG